MSYLLMGILVLLLVGGFITFLVMNATKRSDHATATDDDKLPGIGGDDASPFGDTVQHAGEQSRGETVAGADADTPGGTGRPTAGGSGEGRFQRDPVGGEAEARPFTEAER